MAIFALCCHAATLLPRSRMPFYKALSKDPWQHGSKITKKKIFFQFTARAIINGTLFRNKERLFSNKARLLFNNPGLFGNTLGVILFPFGEKYFPSGENIFSPAGIFIFCRWNSRLTTARPELQSGS
jgi:hypothetical protein